MCGAHEHTLNSELKRLSTLLSLTINNNLNKGALFRTRQPYSLSSDRADIPRQRCHTEIVFYGRIFCGLITQFIKYFKANKNIVVISTEIFLNPFVVFHHINDTKKINNLNSTILRSVLFLMTSFPTSSRTAKNKQDLNTRQTQVVCSDWSNLFNCIFDV